MIVTEKEAKDKWCPHGTAGNYLCKGSECMAWRWKTSLIRHFHAHGDATAKRPKHFPQPYASDWEWRPFDEAEGDPAGWCEPEEKARERMKGYCGLAGESK